MFMIGNFIYAVAQVLDVVLDIYWWVILIRALISWVNPDPYNPIVQFLVRVTEPVLQPFRRLVPPERTGIDLSPLLVMLVIVFTKAFLIKSLIQLSILFQ